MKISVQQYAASLYDCVAGKSEKEAKEVVKNFVAILEKNRDLNKEAAIIEVFNEIWNEANGEVVATLSSARELGAGVKETMVAYLKEKTGAKKVALEEEIDKALIGGFVLRYGSKVLDGSLKTSLNNLKMSLEK